MNIPLLGARDKQMAMRAFEDALHELCQRAMFQGSVPAAQIAMALMHNGMAIHTQAILAQVMQPQAPAKMNGETVHEPQPEATP